MNRDPGDETEAVAETCPDCGQPPMRCEEYPSPAGFVYRNLICRCGREWGVAEPMVDHREPPSADELLEVHRALQGLVSFSDLLGGGKRG